MITGDQVKKFLYTLYPDVKPERYDENWGRYFPMPSNRNELHINVSNMYGTTLNAINQAVQASGIDPKYFIIDQLWGHLTFIISNYDTKSDFDFTKDFKRHEF